jgi:transposase
MLLADRGYDADWIRELAGRKGAWANIPPKRNRREPICFSLTFTGRATWSPSSSDVLALWLFALAAGAVTLAWVGFLIWLALHVLGLF